jgi:hypothetical protein
LDNPESTSNRCCVPMYFPCTISRSQRKTLSEALDRAGSLQPAPILLQSWLFKNTTSHPLTTNVLRLSSCHDTLSPIARPHPSASQPTPVLPGPAFSIDFVPKRKDPGGGWVGLPRIEIRRFHKSSLHGGFLIDRTSNRPLAGTDCARA